MSNDIKYTNNSNKGKSVAGAILLIVGVLLLINQFDFFFLPNWLFSWEMMLIAIGFYLGSKNNFRNSASVILIIIGSAFLLEEIIPGLRSRDIAWPIMIICFGLWMITKRNKKIKLNDWGNRSGNKKDWKEYKTAEEPVVDYTVPPASSSTETPPLSVDENPYTRRSDADYIDAVSIFGGVKKTVLSKDFKGGDIVNIFGGVELDFTQANINGQVTIDITQFFGGIKIIVPPHWKVVSDLAAVFASVDDKRIRTAAPIDGDKVLILKGTSFFAGVDIRSY